MTLKYSDPRDDFQKTLKRFTQVDGHAKNTKQVCLWFGDKECHHYANDPPHSH